METFADNRNMHVNRHSNPDLALYCIFGSTKKRLDSEVLLDPFKNNSICQRDLYKAAIVSGGNAKLFVKNTNVFPVSESSNLIISKFSRYRILLFMPFAFTT